LGRFERCEIILSLYLSLSHTNTHSNTLTDVRLRQEVRESEECCAWADTFGPIELFY
jgi:hypothetical protein